MGKEGLMRRKVRGGVARKEDLRVGMNGEESSDYNVVALAS